MEKKEKRLKSEIIADFLDLLKNSEAAYNFNYDEVQRMDWLKTDIEHRFELKKLTSKQRLVLDKQLVSCLLERRVYKDEAEELEPLRNFIVENKPVYNALTKLLGEVRKVEKKHDERSYFPRVMSVEQFNEGVE